MRFFNKRVKNISLFVLFSLFIFVPFAAKSEVEDYKLVFLTPSVVVTPGQEVRANFKLDRLRSFATLKTIVTFYLDKGDGTTFAIKILSDIKINDTQIITIDPLTENLTAGNYYLFGFTGTKDSPTSIIKSIPVTILSPSDYGLGCGYEKETDLIETNFTVPESDKDKEVRVSLFSNNGVWKADAVGLHKGSGAFQFHYGAERFPDGTYICKLFAGGELKKTTTFTKTFGGIPVDSSTSPVSPSGTLELNVNFPCPSGIIDLTTGNCSDDPRTITGYISRLYQFAVYIAGVLAVGMIVFGGILYSVSGAVDKKNEGKEYIMSALWGLLLLFGAYLILKTANPNLLTLKEPEVTQYVNRTSGWGWDEGKKKSCCLATSTLTSCTEWGYDNEMKVSCCVSFSGTCKPLEACPLPLTSLKTTVGKDMEGGNTIKWTVSDDTTGAAEINQNLNKLKTEFTKLQNAIKEKSGKSVSATSVYRPYEYQKHFWEISRAYQRLQNMSETECADMRTKIEAEISKHGLIKRPLSGGGGLYVASPDTGDHPKGSAVDISVSGIDTKNLADFLEKTVKINSLLKDKGIKLKWQPGRPDPVHFSLNY